MKKEIIKSFNRIDEEINRILEIAYENELEIYSKSTGASLGSMLDQISSAIDKTKTELLKAIKE
jgi:hypothetical protein